MYKGIYLLRKPKTNLYKIGKSNNINRRIVETPKYKLLFTYICDNNAEVEDYIKIKYREYTTEYGSEIFNVERFDIQVFEAIKHFEHQKFMRDELGIFVI